MDRIEFIKQICKIEDEYKLYDIIVDDIKIWPLFRPYILEEIINKENEFSFHPDLQIKYSNFKKAFSLFYNSIFHFNYRKYKDVDNILYFSLRKRKNKDGYYSPLIDPIVDALDNNYLIVERAMPNSGHLGFSKQRNLIFSDRVEFFRALGLIKYRKSKKADKWFSELKKVMSVLESQLNIEINIPGLYSRVVHTLSTFFVAGKQVKKILKYIKPKNIIISPNYELNTLMLIYACKRLNIKVVEIQHGYIGSIHIGYNYNFNYEDNKNYYPDKILVFGEFWKNVIDFPNKEDVVIPVGFPEFEKNTNKLSINHDSKNILVISESNGKHDLSKLCVEFLKNNNPLDYKILFKLHPNECSSWKEIYPELINVNNLTVIDTIEKSVYDYFADSKFVVGTNSTVLFESLGFGLKTCILNTSDFNTEKININNYFEVINKASDLFKIINRKYDNLAENDYKQTFFKSNSVNNIIKELI